MRHRIGIALGVAMAAEVFFAGGWGYLRVLRLPAPGDQLTNLPAGGGALTSDGRVLAALAAVAGTGLLAGILIATPRISPLAARRSPRGCPACCCSAGPGSTWSTCGRRST